VLLLDSGFGIEVSERAATSLQWLFDTDLFQNVVQIPYKLTKVSRHNSRKQPTLRTELLHSFIQYTGSYMFRQ
jgi:hypothetical protein